MTFTFNAVGSADQVREQLALADVRDDLGKAVREFITQQVIPAGAEVTPGHAVAYVVAASGYADSQNAQLEVRAAGLGSGSAGSRYGQLMRFWYDTERALGSYSRSMSLHHVTTSLTRWPTG